MPPRSVISSIVVITAATYLLVYAVQGEHLSDPLRPLGAAISAASLFVVTFDKYLWRAGWVSKLVRRPYLGGTWRGQLASHWIDPDTGERIAPDPEVYLIIRQNYWSVSARLITRESRSFSIIASVDHHGDGTWGLYAIYRNTPRAAVRHRSAIHHGALMLDISGDPPDCLEGFYWTDRTTMGELELRMRFKKHVNDYARAQQLA